MDPHLSSQVHAAAAAASAFPNGKKVEMNDVLPPGAVILDVEAGAPTNAAGADPRDVDGDAGVDYMARAQWLRAAVLGANDGLVSVASLMIGVGAVNATRKAMLVSGMAGLVAGACSMAIGEFVSVYAQYDIEVSQIKRDGGEEEEDDMEKHAVQVLVLAHAYQVPWLKRACEGAIGARLTADSVVDVLQLADLCDAPRLHLRCARLLAKEFAAVERTEAWRFLQENDPWQELHVLQRLHEADMVRFFLLPPPPPPAARALDCYRIGPRSM